MSLLQEGNNAHSLQETVDKTYTFLTSYAQQRLWFLDRLLGASSLYNTPWAIQLNGKLDVPAMQQSLEAIVARHEVLRTCFVEEHGEPVQVIRASMPFGCTLMELSAVTPENRDSEIQRILNAEVNKVFDLRQAPLLRALLLKLSGEEHILLVTIHHSVSDGWSRGVFWEELASFYGAFSQGQMANLPDLPIQYADYAVWQHEWLQGEVLDKQLSYWKTQLADLAVLELPTDKPRPRQLSYRGACETIQLSAALTQGLKILSQQHNVTLFMTLLAALQVLLHRYSGQDDIVVGTAIAGRNRQELENLMGFFANTLVLRTDLSGTPSFVQLLSRVREVCLSAYAHQDIPFEKLVAELQVQRDMSRHPLFQVMLVLQPTGMQDLQLPDLTIGTVNITHETAKFDLSLSLVEHADGLTGTIEYSSDLFNAESITRLAGHFQTLLKAIVEHPESAIAELPLLTTPERHQLLVEWNATQTGYPKDQCIHQLFEEQVATTPDAVAVVFGNESLTYKQLNERANKLAHYLRKLKVGPEVPVALFIERSLDMLVGLLGILKAGGAYVPLDHACPKQRLEFFLADSAATVLITRQPLLTLLPTHSAQTVCLDRDRDVIVQESPDNPPCSSIAENLAYIIYTSGSTGIPKGVSIVHRNTVALISWAKGMFGKEELAGVLASTTYCFDLSIFEFFVPLTQGGRLILVENILQLIASQDNEGITLINTVPSAVTELLKMNRIPGSVQTICLAGEPLKTELVDRLYQQTKVKKVIDLYGPTEDTTYSTVCLREPQKKASIGRPIANTQIYILDKHLQPVPIGVSGEIHIGGDGLARGYRNRPELTAEKFIKHPFSKDPHARLYKTGDLARYLPDGTIQFLGRIDHQIKLRGFRIELGEIESVLGQYAGINEVVVTVREDQLNDKRLVAYLTHSQEVQPNITAIRLFLKERLPEYMVPSAFVLLDTLPLTANGKIDRNALPAPEQARDEFEQAYVQPRSPVEEMLAAIWQEVMNIDRIGIHDNFFALGGHSLLAMQLIVRINKRFQIDFPLYLLFEAPTVGGLSVCLETLLKHVNPITSAPIKALVRKGSQIK